MSPTNIPRSSSPASGWRDRLMPRRQSQEPQAPSKEVSRWSKTTTESDFSEAGLEPVSKRRNFLKKKMTQRRQSKDTSKSSPTDPFYDPVNKQLQPYAGDVPPITTTTRADDINERSFLDDASDGDSPTSPTSPVIQRASSVRVARPQVVQHSNSSAGSIPKLYASQNTPSTVKETSALSKPPQTLGEDICDPLKPAAERSEGPSSALKALEGDVTTSSAGLTALPQILSNDEARDTFRETLVSWPDTPSRLEALDTMPTPMGGFGSMRIPRSSNGTFSTTSTNTYVSPPSMMTDGLRLNPPTETDMKLSRAISAPVRNSRRVMIRPSDLVITKAGHDHKLFRENIVSTPYPARQSSIGEIDGVLALAPASEPQQKGEAKKTPKLRRAKLLPYTPRGSKVDDTSIDISEKSSAVTDDKAPEIPLSTKPVVSTTVPITAKSDRFPSPSAPEILFFDLRLARHPSARITVEIEVTDKTTFDDEQLFTAVRQRYINELMGKARWWFCARTLEAATLNNAEEVSHSAAGNRVSGLWHGQYSTTADFDGADFIRHLNNPKLGHRRKLWLLWLRNHQESFATGGRPVSNRGRRSFLPQPVSNTHSPLEEKSSSPVFSFSHSRQNSSGNANAIPEDEKIDSSTVTSGPIMTGSGLSKQPSTTLPRMPFTSPSTYPSSFSNPTTPSLPTSFSRSKSLALSSSLGFTPHHPYFHSSPHAQYAHPSPSPPQIYLHHTFSLRTIALFTFLLLMLSLLTTIFWILFGVPGRNAVIGDGTTTIDGQVFDVPWRRDAQGRVGVGFVIGVVVLLVGAVLEGGWIWASWVLV